MIFTLFNCLISVTAILFSVIAKVLMERGFFLTVSAILLIVLVYNIFFNVL